MLLLSIDHDRTGFAPGETVRGRLCWDLPSPPDSVALRLFWYTRGRGTDEVALVAEHESPHPTAHHDGPFAFPLPAGPYSFSGQFITLQWAIELLIDGGTSSTRVEFVLSPWETEVRLAPAPWKEA